MSIDFGGSQIGEIYYGSELVGVLGGAEVEEVPIEAVTIGGSSTYHDIASVDAGEGAWVWFKADITRYNSNSTPRFYLNEERFDISTSEDNVAGGGHYTGEVKLQVLTTSSTNSRSVSFSGKLYVMRERIVRHVTELTGDLRYIPLGIQALNSWTHMIEIELSEPSFVSVLTGHSFPNDETTSNNWGDPAPAMRLTPSDGRDVVGGLNEVTASATTMSDHLDRSSQFSVSGVLPPGRYSAEIRMNRSSREFPLSGIYLSIIPVPEDHSKANA